LLIPPEGGYMDRHRLVNALVELIRQRDEGHESRLREERGRAYDAGAWAMTGGEMLPEQEGAFWNGRRAAVEGRKEGDTDG
jgi:hypothetical protein